MGDASPQDTATTTMARQNISTPSQEWSFLPANMKFRFCRTPVTNTSVTWAKMKNRNQHSTKKWIVRAACRFRIFANHPSLLAIAGPCIKPVITARGAATNTCLLYTSDAADDLLCVDLGGRRL